MNISTRSTKKIPEEMFCFYPESNNIMIKGKWKELLGLKKKKLNSWRDYHNAEHLWNYIKTVQPEAFWAMLGRGMDTNSNVKMCNADKDLCNKNATDRKSGSTSSRKYLKGYQIYIKWMMCVCVLCIISDSFINLPS